MKRNDFENVDILGLYFKDIKRTKCLTREKEAELSKKIQEGDRNALNELVEANLKFVVSMAKKYANSGVPMSDLISEGNLALYKAAEKFDPAMKKKFITYAVWWVRSYMNDCVKQFKGNGEEYSVDDYTMSLAEESDGGSFEDMVNDDFEEKITNIQSRGMVIDELVSCLQERELKILSLYFGLYGNKEMTLKEISDEMNMSSERVRQIVNNSITKLKANALMSDNFEEYKDLC